MGQAAHIVTETLANWLQGLHPDAILSVDDTAIDPSAIAIDLRLTNLALEPHALHVQSRQQAGGISPPAATLRLDYFITVHAPDPLVKHRILGEVAFALFDHPVFSLAPDGEVIVRFRQNDTGTLGLAISASAVDNRPTA